jgi:hypothetical protein
VWSIGTDTENPCSIIATNSLMRGLALITRHHSRSMQQKKQRSFFEFATLILVVPLTNT